MGPPQKMYDCLYEDFLTSVVDKLFVKYELLENSIYFLSVLIKPDPILCWLFVHVRL